LQNTDASKQSLGRKRARLSDRRRVLDEDSVAKTIIEAPSPNRIDVMRFAVIDADNVSPQGHPDIAENSISAEVAVEPRTWVCPASRLPSPAAFVALLGQPSYRPPVPAEWQLPPSAGGRMPL